MEAEIASHLLRIDAIKLRPKMPFTWASGIKSPIYCDNRISLTHPTTRNFVKESLAEKSKVFGEFTVVAGVATAGIAHGALLADALGLPFIYVRSKPKGHGRQNMIEGEVKGNENVLVVEDLISTGKSSIQACDALREVGCTVAGVISIFSYEFDMAKENFDNANIRSESLSGYSALLEEASKTGYIDAKEMDVLLEWRKDPKNWKPA